MGDVEQRLGRVEEAVIAIKDSLQLLARLEERHSETRDGLGRAFQRQEKLEERVEVIEKAMPGLIEMRGWLVKANLGTLGIVGLAILGVVILK